MMRELVREAVLGWLSGLLADTGVAVELVELGLRSCVSLQRHDDRIHHTLKIDVFDDKLWIWLHRQELFVVDTPSADLVNQRRKLKAVWTMEAREDLAVFGGCGADHVLEYADPASFTRLREVTLRWLADLHCTPGADNGLGL